MDEPLDAAWRELCDAAKHASMHAHAPYSKFRVGAAVRSDAGTIHTGCNVENASYGATLCAERVAVGKLICAGERGIVAVAIFAEADPPAMPCGVCRQTLAEFAPDVAIMVLSNTAVRKVTLSELFPEPFVFNRP
jgi:cytidine deaminase